MMTRKDYRLIAKAIFSVVDSRDVLHDDFVIIARVQEAISQALYEGNANFDRERFEAACFKGEAALQEIQYFCDECGTQVDEYCTEHPAAMVSSIVVNL